MVNNLRNEEEREELCKVLEQGKLLTLYKKYKYIWIAAYVVGLIVLFAYMKMAGNPGIAAFLFFVVTFGIVVVIAYRKIGMSYQKERNIITQGKEDSYPFV